MSAGRVDFDFRLDGKTALVTGGAAGIGAAIAAGYAAKGARIAVVDLNETVAAQTASGLSTESRGFYCDVADPDSVRGTVDAVLDVFGRVDILVNSAGVVHLAAAEDLSVNAWDATIDVNLKGTFLMCQAAGRSMLEAGGGVIVNMGSQPPPSHWTSTWPTVRRSSVWWGCRRCWQPNGARAVCASTPSRPLWCSPNSVARRGTARTVMRSRSSSRRDGSPIRTRSPRPQCIWRPTPRRWSTAPTWSSTGLHHQVVATGKVEAIEHYEPVELQSLKLSHSTYLLPPGVGGNGEASSRDVSSPSICVTVSRRRSSTSATHSKSRSRTLGMFVPFVAVHH
jgi:hypothetical protein